MPKKTKQTVGELIFGIHPTIELLKAKRRKLITLYTTKPVPKSWNLIEKIMPKYPVPIQYVSRDVLHRMAETTDHQNVVSWVQPFPFRKKEFEPKKSPFLILLDGVQDPRNVGAILRSAYCTGVTGVILCKKNAAPLTATVIKSAAGLSEHLDIFIAPSPESAAQELKKAGYTLYLATLDGQNATTCNYEQPSCLVIGNEAIGVSSQLYKYGTQITLPQRTSDISYNASAAASILLFLMSSKQGILK